ncbi:hypothetical protein R1flu_013890 [Riccia fluitans]|uniref:Uncharacterized protein n=1 Tax=Riccia fluitans TaxID=41844 RepID=A0ABD1YFN4_9MARC
MVRSSLYFEVQNFNRSGGLSKPADNLTLLVKWDLSMDGKAMDVVGSNEGSHLPQEIADIVETDVDAAVGTASS